MLSTSSNKFTNNEDLNIINLLIGAIKDRNEQEFNKHLQLTSDENLIINNNEILKIACREGIVYFVQSLLNIEAVKNIFLNDHKMEAFTIAAQSGHKLILNHLLSYGKIPGQNLNSIQLVLNLAIGYDHLNIVKALLRREEFSKEIKLINSPAFNIAILSKNSKVIKLLLEHLDYKQKLDISSMSKIGMLIDNNDFSNFKRIVNLFEENNNSILKYNDIQIEYLYKSLNKIDFFKFLLSLDVITDNIAQDENFIFLSCLKTQLPNHNEMIDLLLQFDSVKKNANYSNNYALRLAEKLGNDDIIDKLLWLDNVRSDELSNNGQLIDRAKQIESLNNKNSPYSCKV